VLKCDIQKYFQSIDHEILLEMISNKIACAKTWWLFKEIINSHADTWHLRVRLLESAVFQRGKTRGAAGRLLEQQPA